MKRAECSRLFGPPLMNDVRGAAAEGLLQLQLNVRASHYDDTMNVHNVDDMKNKEEGMKRSNICLRVTGCL